MNRKCKYGIYVSCFLFFAKISFAQKQLKVKKEDNHFFFYVLNQQQDSMIHLESAVFKIKTPDSCAKRLYIDVKNGQFVKTNSTQQYRLKYIPGIKYEQQIIRDSLSTNINGGCKIETNRIEVHIYDSENNKVLIKKKYVVTNQ
jgi:hypothetical protein